MAYQSIYTIRGYDFGEVASALQKSIRRGLEQDALYWAVELDRSGYGNYVWKRLLIITSEDVGLAEPNMPANIRALYDTWVELKKRKEKHGPERLCLVHAVLLLSRAKKSRICDNALLWNYSDHVPFREIPDVALDKHTIRGRKKGRGFDHFFAEGTELANHSGLVDDYLENAKALYLGELGEPTNSPGRGAQTNLFDAVDELPT